MNIIERIDRGEVTLIAFQNIVEGSGMSDDQLKKHMDQDSLDVNELLRLARRGQAMDWVDGAPPAFGAEDRIWIIFEHLTPFTRATVYATAVWLGKYYSEEKIKLARRWTLMPLPPAPEVKP